MLAARAPRSKHCVSDDLALQEFCLPESGHSSASGKGRNGPFGGRLAVARELRTLELGLQITREWTLVSPRLCRAVSAPPWRDALSRCYRTHVHSLLAVPPLTKRNHMVTV
jgi:hypothetical protein